MDEKNYENYENDVFICNAQECFNANAKQTTHLKDKNLRTSYKNKCSLCSYDFDNLEELREEIYNEIQLNKTSKSKMIKAKIIEILITLCLGVMVFFAIIYFLFRVYMINR